MSDLALLLTGAAIALVSSIITAIAAHLLSLRADRIKRERDRIEREAEKLKVALSDGARLELSVVRDEIEKLRVTGAGDATSILVAAQAIIESFKEEEVLPKVGEETGGQKIEPG